MPLSGRRVLCVVVSSTGFIENKVIETEEDVPREELVRISNYLTENFAGQTLRQIRERLLRMMAEERAQMDRLLARTLELARSGLAVGESPEVVVDGTSIAARQARAGRPPAGAADVRDLRRQGAAGARCLNQCIHGGGVRVLIGEDSDLTSELGFSWWPPPTAWASGRSAPWGSSGPPGWSMRRSSPWWISWGRP